MHQNLFRLRHTFQALSYVIPIVTRYGSHQAYAYVFGVQGASPCAPDYVLILGLGLVRGGVGV